MVSSFELARTITMRVFLYLLISLLFFTTPLYAQDLYVSYLIGHTMTEDSDINLLSDPDVNNVSLDFSNATSGSLSIGKYFNDHIRGEWEISYREPNLDRLSGSDALGNSASIDVSNFLRTTTLMYRVQYDFTEHEKYPFQPYISGGLGFAHHKIDFFGEGEDDAVVAYQLGAGLMWEFGPLNYIVAEYRYLASQSADFNVESLNYNGSDINVNGVSADYAAHEFRLGVLMGF